MSFGRRQFDMVARSPTADRGRRRRKESQMHKAASRPKIHMTSQFDEDERDESDVIDLKFK
jgi:hypothetical protein